MSISIGSGASALSALQYMLQSSSTSATAALPANDKAALKSAISDIKPAFGSGSASAASIKTSVESAIDGEITSGKLNGTQAAKLKGMFETALAQAQGTTATDATTATTSTTATDGVTGAVSGLRGIFDGLTSAVSELRSAVKGNGLYGAGGSTVGRVGSLLVNALA